ncbi:MAG: glycosyltransferase family 4 protein [Bacteroides sp.]
MKDKIAFVVTGYGKEINGGVEQHCRMLAERLTNDYNIEVLTTCVKNYKTGGNDLPPGTEWINGVQVRRFEADPVDRDLHDYYVRKSKRSTRLRKHLYQLGLLSFISSIHPLWTFGREMELKVLRSYPTYSSSLIRFLSENRSHYKAVIPLNVSFPLAYFATNCCPQKTIVIPTMHHESSSFRSLLTETFIHAAYIGFNTAAEEKLAESIFGRKLAPHGIISVGIEEAVDADWLLTKKKYNLPENYLLYVGRVDSGKMSKLVEYYLGYKKKYQDSDLKLVLVGGLFTNPISHPDIFYTGFVNDGEKSVIIQKAKVLVNPSRFESLSLILLEGMKKKKAMLVNGNCTVLKEHCENSGGAAIYYQHKADFISKLHSVEQSESRRIQMGDKGRKYVEENYDWAVILDRLRRVIDQLGH